jgi:hypothetical protein
LFEDILLIDSVGGISSRLCVVPERQVRAQTTGREARPATPEAGVLPAYKLPVEL